MYTRLSTTKKRRSTKHILVLLLTVPKGELQKILAVNQLTTQFLIFKCIARCLDQVIDELINFRLDLPIDHPFTGFQTFSPCVCVRVCVCVWGGGGGGVSPNQEMEQFWSPTDLFYLVMQVEKWKSRDSNV